MLVTRKRLQKLVVKVKNNRIPWKVLMRLSANVLVMFLIAYSIYLCGKISIRSKSKPVLLDEPFDSMLLERDSFRIVNESKNVVDKAKTFTAQRKVIQSEPCTPLLFRPKIIKLKKHRCSISRRCSTFRPEIAFKVWSGTASVLGPVICLNNTIVMSSSLNNVGRGLNVAVLNVITGKLLQTSVFDFHQKKSDQGFWLFLKKFSRNKIFIVTTANDASRNFDKRTRKLLKSYGSVFAITLSFRDNWAFVGGRKLTKSYWFESIAKNRDLENNKYGQWPARVSLEGCIPIFPKK